MKRVLVTAIGTVTATAIVKELKKAGDYYIIGADINKRNEVATALDVDEFYSFPYSTNEEYVSFAASFCKEHRIDYYFAVIDQEVVNVSRNKSLFEKAGTVLCMVNHEFASLCHYKNKFGQWVSKNFPEIGIKEYRSIEELKAAIYPVFIKPNEGVASRGCRIVNSFDELMTLVHPEEVGDTIIVQEYIEGANITVDCIRNKKYGQTRQIQRKELLRNANGCGIAVKIINIDKLELICNRIMEALDLDGVANIEFFEVSNEYKIIEINPRFSAGTEYSCMAGINTVLNAIRIADKKECVFGEIEVGAQFAERYEAYRMN